MHRARGLVKMHEELKAIAVQWHWLAFSTADLAWTISIVFRMRV